MAGDWLKWRIELYTHPRFLRLVRCLVSEGTGLAAHGVTFRHEASRTERDGASRGVTLTVTHDVTMSALMRVWSSVNAHCKVPNPLTGDAVCTGIGLPEIDTLAGVDGFGRAMAEAGWVRVNEERNSLVFPNFLEFNEPACMRPVPLSAAQRAARYREGRRTSTTGQETAPKKRVTKRHARHDREEKRREEKNNKKKDTSYPKKKFVKPTLEEVAAYCRKRGNSVDPQLFIDFYESKGWVIGKNPMRDWQASVRTWEKNDRGGLFNGTNQPGGSVGPTHRVRAEPGKYDAIKARAARAGEAGAEPGAAPEAPPLDGAEH